MAMKAGRPRSRRRPSWSLKSRWLASRNRTVPSLHRREDIMTTPSGLQYEDQAEGQGTPAKAGDRVQVHYTGWLKNGTKFDSSLDRGKPFDFVLGKGMVIKGWDEGVAGMKPGGKRRLI